MLFVAFRATVNYVTGYGPLYIGNFLESATKIWEGYLEALLILNLLAILFTFMRDPFC